MSTITILGAGVMGSAMVLPFVDRGMTVRLVGTDLDGAIVDSVRDTGLHPRLNITLPKSVETYQSADLHEALVGADLILLGVASAGVDWAIARLDAALKTPTPIVMITKGLKPDSAGLLALPDVVAEALEHRLGFRVPVAAIAGPCIAGELAARRPTGTVIVSRDLALAARLCQMFETDYYHPRPSFDMMGAEICAAFKNFFAIAVGWAHGRMDVMAETQNKARNNNAAAILFDQAIGELMHLVKAHGGSSESVWGMPGVGDLYVTCQAGRNSRLGNHMGRGLSYAEVKQGPMKDDTIEGAELGRAVATCLEMLAISGKLNRHKLPLTFALLKALTDGSVFDPPWRDFART